MASIPIRAVLFDFGGVIAEEGFQHGLYEIAQAQGIDPLEFFEVGQAAVHDTGYVVGRAPEADFWNVLRERFDLAGTDAELGKKILDNFLLRPQMLTAVRLLHQHGLLCVLVSDQTDWLERLNSRDHFYQEFDRIFNSYYLGKTKRDPSIFDEVLKELGVKPEETVFVDDKPGHVERARSRGLKALVFTSTAQCLTELESLLGITLQKSN